uniref:Uncharacterized protein n=1 Tax=viral metagenome TaxID=1070528 RepID=A0A6C0HK29_9ZZZZ
MNSKSVKVNSDFLYAAINVLKSVTYEYTTTPIMIAVGVTSVNPIMWSNETTSSQHDA